MPEPFPILKSLILEQTGESSYRGPSVPSEVRPVVFGGQLMGQMIVAATTCLPGKTVRSLHAIFARAGTVTQPVDLEVDVMHAGRALGSGHEGGQRAARTSPSHAFTSAPSRSPDRR